MTSTPAPILAEEALDAILRDLVGIYGSLGEALTNDPEVIPWTMRELHDIIDYIRTVKRRA